MEIVVKICAKCKAEKEESNFTASQLEINSGWCKPCVAIKSKKWAQENPDKTKVSRKKWRTANPEKVAAYDKKWRKENPEKKNRAITKRWILKNPKKKYSK